MSKKIISFTLLSVTLLFSLTSLEAMRFRGLLKSPKILLAKRLAIPAAVAAAGTTYALAESNKKPLMVTPDEELVLQNMIFDNIDKLNKEVKEESSSSALFSVKKSPIKLTEKEIAEKNLK